MGERRWEIGICGTFDVANYGDLLFPLIAESELKERLGDVTLHRFSYHGKKPPEWPYEVTSVTRLPEMIHRLDGLLIGGGFLIRFDTQVAPEYLPPGPEIHHPTGYWLTPALIALQNNVPLVWNGPGMHCNDIPKWANPLVEMAFTLSPYVSVRDEPSRAALEPFAKRPVAVIPDTVFRLPRLLNIHGQPSAEFTRLCQASGLDRPYIVLQATAGQEEFIRFVRNHADRFRDFQFLGIPISPVLGERQEIVDADLPGLVRLAEWPNPLLLAELIGRSEAAVGHSYHLIITALTSGVPVFTRQNLSEGKYAALRHFEELFAMPPNGQPDIEWFLSRVGRKETSHKFRATCEPLVTHWDRIATVFRDEPAPTASALNRFWQSLPALLEDAATREGEYRERALSLEKQVEIARLSLEEHIEVARRKSLELQAKLRGLTKQLSGARTEIAARGARIEELLASVSWRLAAPLRLVAGLFRGKPRRRLINLDRIKFHTLETDPYGWAAVHDLFRPDDAARLAATYPCDHFKIVAAQGGEKDYQYEARELIGMGADAIAHRDDLSDEWRALAADLLSPEYRAAMMTLTGCDLTNAPMEVNVFHYGRGGSLGAHRDLPEKLLTHVLYFNRTWNIADGGCLGILRSADASDLAAEIPPLVGYSSVIVRSENSWHAVSRVASDSAHSRRSVTVTFYRPGSVSSMWPPGDTTPLHNYHAVDLA